MSKPLTKRQIIAICQIAAKAFKIMSPGLGDMTPEDFRHGEIFNVTGHTSLKTCTQRHYTPPLQPLCNHDGATTQAGQHLG